MKTHWPTVTIGDVAKVVSGATPKTSVEGFWGGGIPWATPKDLSRLEGRDISETERTLTPEGLQSCAASVLPPNSVLLSSRAPIGYVAVNTRPMATNQGFKSLIPDPARVEPNFLYWWLKTNRPRIEALGNGATFKEISKRTTESIEIPLPPLAEQRRIAEILDTADELRQKRRETIGKLDSLSQSVFLEMFGDPIANPYGWELTEFSLQFSGIRYGTGSPPPYVESGVPFVRATDIKRGRVVLDGIKTISLDDARSLEKCRLSTGDMIIVRSGVNTGDCALVPESLNGACAAYDMIVTLPPDSRTFYQFLLDSVFGKSMLAPLKRRAAQPHLNAQQISRLRLIAPPRRLRQEFHARMTAVDQEHQAQKQHQGDSERLFGSLQQQAFKGGL